MRIKKEINIQIGEQIKQAREQAQWTQELLAERIDVSTQYVSDLERGVVGISLPTLKRLCVSLCVSSDQILFGTMDQSREKLLAEQCRGLTQEQFLLLSEIIARYVIALDTVK